ncbi:hypothetical protein PVAP13_8KG093984 [Panicum virgatum]|uniref:Uncharacterized protein n=1 Tax=Panicum virgatum TaxID=38727 RepID=A0A8T0PKG8_PANVG|nr:hypothetical protein PVAP13_8KG093984 [Panicum virgatum]
MYSSGSWCPACPPQSMVPSSTPYWIPGLQHPDMAGPSAHGFWWAPSSSTNIEDSDLKECAMYGECCWIAGAI